MMNNYNGKILVGGHRGDCFNFYENTMQAFEAAIEVGVDMIEMDVRLSKDDVLVIIHDATVDRTTDGIGNVCDMTADELLNLNAGDEDSPAKIPLFSDFMRWANEKKIMLNIEIKEYYSEENEQRCRRCIEGIVEQIDKYDMADKVVINSFDAWVLEYLFEKYGKKYVLHGHYPYSKMKNLNLNPDTYLDCANISDILQKEYYDYLIKKNIEPWVGANVTQESKINLASKYGAKVITINNPGDAIMKLKKTGWR
ncbi:MAG: glycerophosphodiester phosphodiesterase family protein [Clostridia bacterium]|nr:glycerophosphodiester phosphodiesterase family protein [Clostridia bacterium]